MRLRFQSLHTSLLIAVLVGYPFIASVTNAIQVNNTPVSIALRSLVIMVAILLLAAPKWRTFPKKLRLILGLFALFWFLYMARLIADTLLVPESLGRDWKHYWIWGVGGCLIPLMGIASRLSDPHDAKPFRIAFAIISLTLVLAVIFGDTAVLRRGEIVDQGRFQLEALNAISLGNVGAITVVLAIWRLTIAPRRPKGFMQVAFYASAAILGLYLTLLTGSRGPLVGLIVATMFVIFNTGLGSKAFIVIFAVGMVILGYNFLKTYSGSLNINTLERLARVGSDTDLSSVGRLYMLESGWREFFTSPIIGSGLEVRSVGFYPHNLITESFMATGVLGGSVFTLILLVATVHANRLLKLRLNGSWFSVVFLYYATLGQFSGALYQSPYFWGAIGGVILTYGGYLERSRPLSASTVLQRDNAFARTG